MGKIAGDHQSDAGPEPPGGDAREHPAKQGRVHGPAAGRAEPRMPAEQDGGGEDRRDPHPGQGDGLGHAPHPAGRHITGKNQGVGHAIRLCYGLVETGFPQPPGVRLTAVGFRLIFY